MYLIPACRSSVSANLAIEKIKKEIPNAKGTQSSTFQTGITTERSMTFDILHHTLDGIYYTRYMQQLSNENHVRKVTNSK